MALVLLLLLLILASATAVRYDDGSMAEVTQRMIDAQSLDRSALHEKQQTTDSLVYSHYGASFHRPDGFAKRSLVSG